MKRKNRTRTKRARDDKLLTYVSWLGKQHVAGRKGLLTKTQAKDIEISTHKALLDRVSLSEVQNRIAMFRRLPFDQMTYKDVHKAVGDVVFVSIPNGEHMAMMPWTVDYHQPGSLFYRGRKDKIPMCIDDCWNPPASKVRPSRLNRGGESMLYTSPSNHQVVLDEIGAKPKDAVSLIIYRVSKRIRVIVVGVGVHRSYLTEEQAKKQDVLFEFLYSEFTRPVEPGHEHLYQISQVISKKFLHEGPKQDGWRYPSVKTGEYWNVCLLPDRARDKLELVGVVGMTVLKRSGPELQTCNHFFGTVKDGQAMQYGKFTMEHGKLMPGAPVANAVDIPEVREVIRLLETEPGSWPHLYQTEMKRIHGQK